MKLRAHVAVEAVVVPLIRVGEQLKFRIERKGNGHHDAKLERQRQVPSVHVDARRNIGIVARRRLIDIHEHLPVDPLHLHLAPEIPNRRGDVHAVQVARFQNEAEIERHGGCVHVAYLLPDVLDRAPEIKRLRKRLRIRQAHAHVVRRKRFAGPLRESNGAHLHVPVVDHGHAEPDGAGPKHGDDDARRVVANVGEPFVVRQEHVAPVAARIGTGRARRIPE